AVAFRPYEIRQIAGQIVELSPSGSIASLLDFRTLRNESWRVEECHYFCQVVFQYERSVPDSHTEPKDGGSIFDSIAAGIPGQAVPNLGTTRTSVAR
ncbi:hypothetical protein WG66_016242, partial [Moniliophthora roreri]